MKKVETDYPDKLTSEQKEIFFWSMKLAGRLICPKITECLYADKGNIMSDKNRTEKVEFTVLCLTQDGNRILLQNRVKEDWKGYTLPGGHVEPGE